MQARAHVKMTFFTTLALLLLFGCGQSPKETGESLATASDKPLKVILMVGDGMGLSQVSSSFFFNDQPTNFWRFKHIGLINTTSSSHRITDSAAGATAFSCGEKTYNGAINVDSAGAPLKNITEILAGKNYKNGLVSTSSITHATPACFFAVADKRSKEELIASQMHTSHIDIFTGGGQKFFAAREDRINYLDSLVAADFEVHTDQLLPAANMNPESKYGFLLAEGAMPKMTEGRGDFLKSAVELSIAYLNKNKEGFFLMVEGSQIDWGGHANDGEYTITEMVDFDKAIGAALDFAEKDGNTLVIVTADHETGGFTLSATTTTDETGKTSSDYNELTATFSTSGHSATLIPVFAYGPGAESFAGVYENTEIFHKILGLTGK